MIGRTISHYKILEKLGEGGMGVVYRAQDSRLDRFVAIKLLAAHLSTDEAARRRFIHEAKAVSSIDHPNIATVHDIGETPDGQIFIVMAYYQGRTLRDDVAGRSCSIEEALALASQIAGGLGEAHSKGVVHRDVKPANIMVTESGQAKVVDFGLAKLRDVTKVTRSGTTVGTISYMSPEQTRGEEVDARSDIFSMGCVFYELLTGRLPFTGDHDAAIVYSITNEDPSPIAKYRSGVPDGIQRIVDKALAKDPDKRYQSAKEFKRDVDAFLSGSGEVSVMKSIGKRRLPLWSALVFVVVLAAVIFALKQWRDVESPIAVTQALAIVDFRDFVIPDDSPFPAGMTGLLHVGLIESAPCRVISTEYLYNNRRRLFGSAAGTITIDQALDVARECGASILLSGQRYGDGANQYITWQLVDAKTGASLGAKRVDGDALAVLADKVIEGVLPLLAKRCGDVESPAVVPVTDLTSASPDAYAHYVAGMDAYEKSERKDAIRELETAVKIDSTFALAWFGLAQVYRGRRTVGATDGGEVGCAAGERAWALRSRLGIKDRMLLEAWLARDCRGDIPGAIETHREIVSRWPDSREAIVKLSDMLYWIHMNTEAASVAEEGLRKYPDEVELKQWLAYSLANTSRVREALVLFKQLAAADADDPDLWSSVGSCFLATGEPDSAEAAFQRALEIDPGFVGGRLMIPVCAFFRGNVDDAIEKYRQIDLAEFEAGMLNWILLGNFGIVQTYAECGRYQQAIAILDTLLEDRDLVKSFGAVTYIRFILPDYSRITLATRRGLEEALEKLANAPGPEPAFRARWDILNIFMALDSTEVARSHYEEWRKGVPDVFPPNVYWWLTNAEFALADGRPEEALRFYEQVEQTGTSRGSTIDIMRRSNIARAYRMLGRHDEAAEVLEGLVALYKGHFIGWYKLGQVYEEMDRAEKAIEAYETFLDGWSDADPGLVQAEDARRRLAALRDPKNQ